ncbi:unnamed protein product [Darwinula stevensoni]|uniref:Cuticle protein n=1 Tax=Darwinula stevensoni TaxID=69355 RepID=A0A7R8X4X8_9CRUS|nr:unnamed protein product [Darwinula stevensoni]CAG0886065.1 unnamed protein product [Darwinula stevensoni]
MSKVVVLALLACSQAIPVPDGAHHSSHHQPNPDTEGYPVYVPPASTYQAPQPVYQAPTPAPVPAPQPTYEAPQQGYAPVQPLVPVQIHYDYSFNAAGVKKPDAGSGYAPAQGYAPPTNTYQAPQAGYAPAQTGYAPQGYDVPVQVSFDQIVLSGENGGQEGYAPAQEEGDVTGYAPAQGYGQESNADSPAKYHFLYTVNDQTGGDVKGHEETRDGVFAQGKYYVLQPDGKLRTVNYHTDDWGFKADVSYT